MLYAAVALAGLLVLGGGAAYFAFTPPAPTSARLLAAARAGHGEDLLQRSKMELCLSNIDYGMEKINAAQYDQRMQNWLNTLVAAGLYSPGVAITSGGYFARDLVQYAATPELAKWRDGQRLCLAKGVEIADVSDIQEPSEKVRRNGASAPRLHTVQATLVLQALDAAPWLDKAGVHSALLGQVPGWQYQGGKLQKQVPEVFGLRDNQWATGPAYRAELKKQDALARRASAAQGNSAGMPSVGGVFAGLGQLFSFGGHPMQGTWQVKGAGAELFGGAAQADGLGASITFTGNTMELAGQSIKCSFEVEENRVKVTPDGNSESYIFEMRDKNTAIVDLGFFQLTYKRVQ